MADNNILEQALETFINERSKENYAKIMEQLEKAIVLLPAMFPEEMDEKTKDMIKAGKNVRLPKNAKIIPCLLKKETGEQVLPIYSSATHIPKERRSPTLLTMPFLICVNMALTNQDKVNAVVLNPFTQNIVVTKEILEVAQRRGKMSQSKTVRVSEKQFHHLAHRRMSHDTLPGFLFEKPEENLRKLQQEEGRLLLNLCTSLYPDKMKPPYNEDAFSVMTLNITENMQITRIDLPEQYITEGSCLRAYTVFKRDSGTLQYYMIEKAKNGNQVSRIGSDKKHEVVGAIPDNGAEIETIMNFAEGAD